MGSPTELANEVRLFSRAPRLPSDVVAPEHAVVHADLELWGLGMRERYHPDTCASVEKFFRSKPKQRRLTPLLIENERLREIDRAVRLMAMRVPQHHRTVRLYYVGEKVTPGHVMLDKRMRAVIGRNVRFEPAWICRLVVINWQDWPRWIGHCRSIVMNIVREIE